MRHLLAASAGVFGDRWHRLCANQGAAIMGAFALVAGGCAPEETYDVITNVDPSKAALVDDTAPAETAFDPALSYRGRNGAELNHSRDRYRFDVAAFRDDAERLAAERLYPSHGAFLQAKSAQATLPSVQTMGTYVKQLDDTIYAGVERALQDGTPALASKRLVLTGALEHLQKNRGAAADDALVLVAAALRLGAAKGDEPVVPADLVARVDALTAGFLATPAVAKPQGFYTWSPELTKIWQQDRLLQTVPDARATSCALASAIGADPTRRTAYVQLVHLYDRLTNPVKSSLVDVLDQAAAGTCAGAGAPLAFLGRSATPEVALFQQLYPNGVPASADLMGDLIAAIRAGTVDLTPKPGDGWYAHQLFGLETLLVTDRSEERRKIAFMTKYKKRLQEAFATMLVQHRETHVKQSDEVATVSAPAPPPTPDFRVEPMATVYVRHARSYVFLERALDEVLGPEVLDQGVIVDAKGPGTETLRQRIHLARDRFFGLYVVAAQDIGLPFSLSVAGDPLAADIPKLGEDAAKWLATLSDDPIAQSDVRVLVPIAQIDAAHTKYWAVIGVRGTLAGYSYLKGADTSAPLPADQSRRLLPTEQFLEVVSSATPLTREEYRVLCDEAKTADGIAAALSARLASRSPMFRRLKVRARRSVTLAALLVLGIRPCAEEETYEEVITQNPSCPPPA